LNAFSWKRLLILVLSVREAAGMQFNRLDIGPSVIPQ
jgi:hypothetical protein